MDQRNTAIATAFLGHVARARGHHDQAVGHHARAAELFSELGNTPGVAWSRYDLALLARHRGDADGAAGHLRESLTRFREMGDARAVECATWALLTVELRRERVDGTERLLAEARGCRGAPPHGPGVATCLGAVSLMGCACREQEAARFPRPARTPETRRKLSAIAPIARTRDGYALPGSSLTVREQQVARLVARGVDQSADRAGTRDRREDHRDARAQHHPRARRPEPGRGRGSRQRRRAVGLGKHRVWTQGRDPKTVLPIPRPLAAGVPLSPGDLRRRHVHCREDDVLRGGGQVAGGVHLQRPVPVLGRRGPGRGRDVRLDPGLVRRPRGRSWASTSPTGACACPCTSPATRSRGTGEPRDWSTPRYTPQQQERSLDAFSGRLGGPIADLAALVAQVVAVERVPIVFDVVDGRGHTGWETWPRHGWRRSWARPG